MAVTNEEKQTFESEATSAQATYQQAVANRDQAGQPAAHPDRSPVNGYVTNLLAHWGTT